MILAFLLVSIACCARAAKYDQSPFGINGLNMIHGREDPNVFANGEVTAKLLKNAGIRWTRLELWWGVIEPEQGKFDWTFADKVAKLYKEQGMNGMCLLCYSSEWYRKPPDNAEERAKYADYVYQMVNRYKDTFHVWEIWNEPNIPTFWPEPNVRDYTLMLKEAYKAAKRADPNCTILAAATSGPDLDYIKGIYANGGWEYCDAISIHPYSMCGGPIAQRLDKTLRIHQEYIKSKGKPKPLWITEMGWTSKNPEEDRDQAVYLVQSYVTSLANGVEKLFWFCLDDWGEKWGIVRNSNPFDPKPSYEAYKRMTEALGSPGKCAEFEGYVKMPVGVACYVFKKPDNSRVLVVWADGRTAKSVSFPGKSRLWRMKDILGRPVDTVGSNAVVGQTPIIITGVGAGETGPVSKAFNPYQERKGQNQALNGSMNLLNGQGGADWWNPGRFEGSAKDGTFATTKDGRKGSYCASIAKSGERAAYDQGPMPVDVGKAYKLTGWIKTENATGNNQIAFFWYSGNMWTYQGEVRTKSITGTNGWTKVSVTAKVPEGTTMVRVNLISEKNTGITWFDDISLTEE